MEGVTVLRWPRLANTVVSGSGRSDCVSVAVRGDNSETSRYGREANRSEIHQ